MANPTVTWTGLVPSTSKRISKRTGRLIEYRVTLFSDGSGTCTCPAQIFRETRGPADSSDCKHIDLARRVPNKTGPAPAPPPTVAEVPAKGAPSVQPDDFLDEFADDPFLDLPQIRHERS